MSTINFKIDYNSVKTTNPEMESQALARKSRYIKVLQGHKNM